MTKHHNGVSGHTEFCGAIAMKTLVGNPFETCNDRDVICVITNGTVKTNGRAMMGQGIAKFFRDSFSNIDAKLGKYIKEYGNRVFNLGTQDYSGKPIIVFSFPTRADMSSKTDVDMIKKSVQELILMCDKFKLDSKIYLPAPVVTTGAASWADVAPALAALDDRFVVYSTDAKAFQ